MNSSILDEPSVNPLPTYSNKEDNLNLPPLVARIKAVVVDSIILLVVFASTSVIIDAIGGTSDFVKGFIAMSMLLLYDPCLTAFTGSTIGHKILGLKVRQYAERKSNISIIQAFLRFFTKATLGWLSFLTVTTNKDKRAIHDMAGGSIITY